MPKTHPHTQAKGNAEGGECVRWDIKDFGIGDSAQGGIHAKASGDDSLGGPGGLVGPPWRVEQDAVCPAPCCSAVGQCKNVGTVGVPRAKGANVRGLYLNSTDDPTVGADAGPTGL